MRVRSLLWLGALWLASPGLALDSRLRTSQYQVQCYGVAHGLPQGSVHALAQHPSGYLLLGTNRGLSRFDGARISPFEIDDRPVLEGTQIHRLLISDNGDTWVGTFNGLYRFSDAGMRRFSVDDGLSQNRVIALRIESDGVWVGTQGGAVVIDASASSAQPPLVIGSMRVNSFDRDPDGTLWLAATDGLFRQRPGGPIEALSTGIYWSTLREGSGRRWFGSREGLSWLDPQAPDTLVEADESDGMPRLPVRQVLQDRDGQLWFANGGAGLYRLKAGRFERMPGLASDVVYALTEDAEGNLWAGTSGGFCRIRDGAILGFGMAEGLGTDFILSVAADRADRVYVGSNGRGLYRLDNGGVEFLGNPGGNPFVNWVGVLSDGRLLVSSNAGTYEWTDAGARPLHPQLEGSGAAWVAADREGTLWLRTGNLPLQRLRAGQVEAVPMEGGNARWGFTARDGAVWITAAGVLYRGLGEDLQRVADLNDQTSTTCQYEDPNGVVWCTGPGGLRRVDQGKVVLLAHPAFAESALLALQPGPDDSLWMATTAGLYRATMVDLDAYAEGSLTELPLRRFDERHGMRSSEFTRAYAPGLAARSADGQLWWATMAGVVAIDPQRLARASAAPVATVEALKVDDVSVPAEQWSRLGPRIGRMAIRYTALSLSDAASLQFRYRLQPGLKEWTETMDREMVTYGLPAGDYRFEVQASFDRGRWPDGGSELVFRVLPLWYQTWWAHAAGLVLGMALLVGAPLLRIRVLRRRARVLSAQIAACTQELRVANARLDQIARTDALTGIANRRHFDEHLLQRLRQPELPLALLIADVDAFKAYNDRYGHLAGDECLRQVARALSEFALTPDALLARFGGEEFVLLLEGTAAAVAERRAQQMVEAVRALAINHPDAPAGTVSISIGYTRRSEPGESGDDLIERADQALYRAKAEGRDRVRVG